MTNSPLISIIMPVYNSELHLHNTISKIIQQTYKNWELICVDDGSTDESYKILSYYHNIDDRIKIFQIENSGSASRPRNIALQLAKGHYICQHDSDDYISENTLELTVSRAIETEADCLLTVMHFEHPGNPLKNYSIIGANGNCNAIITGKEALILSLDFQIAGMIFCKSELIKSIGYNEIGMNGDEYTTRKLFSLCKKVAFSQGIYYYIQHEQSITKKISPKSFDVYTTNNNLLTLLIEINLEKPIIYEFIYKSYIELFFGIDKLLKHKRILNKMDFDQSLKKIKSAYDQLDKNLLKNAIKYKDVFLPKKIILYIATKDSNIFSTIAYAKYYITKYLKRTHE